MKETSEEENQREITSSKMVKGAIGAVDGSKELYALLVQCVVWLVCQSYLLIT